MYGRLLRVLRHRISNVHGDASLWLVQLLPPGRVKLQHIPYSPRSLLCLENTYQRSQFRGISHWHLSI